MIFPNKYPSVCSNKSCSVTISPLEGFVQKTDSGFIPWCKKCVPERMGHKGKITEEFEVYFDYNPSLVSLIKSLPKAKWNPNKKCWSVSKAVSDRNRILDALNSAGISIPDSISNAEIEYDKDILNLIESKGMYPYQKEGSKFISLKDKCLLGDEMGLGKSVQALMSIPKSSPVLIICRAGLKYNWYDEILKWRDDLIPTVLSGKGNFFWPINNEAIIVNHDILPDFFTPPDKKKSDSSNVYLERIKEFRRNLTKSNPEASSTYLIVDEAHDFKNYKTQRSKKVKEICRCVKKVVGLTGSPLTNKPQELYGVFDVLGIAGETFGSFTNFKNLFNAHEQVVNKHGQKVTVWGKPKEIVPELLKRSMLRRLRKEVLPELPLKTYTNLLLDINDEKLKKKLDGFWEDWKDELDSTSVLPPFSCFSEIRKEISKSRIPQMLEYVEESEDQKIPLVVFSSHLAPLDNLLTRPGWAVISGDTPSEDRQKIVRAFQCNKLKGVGVSIRAGGVGITLTNAWKALFVDLDWSPASNWQAEDRIARIGQKSNKVEIVRMLSNHPLDIHVHRLLSDKIKIIQASVDGTVKLDNNSETEEDFLARMKFGLEKQEKIESELVKEKILFIREREIAKTNNVDFSFCKNSPDLIRESFRYMLSVCDGAVSRDGNGFNKPDSVMAHFILSSGLVHEYELETAYLILTRYKRQLFSKYPSIFQK